MTVRVYRSTDASAPVLSGQSGALVALFYACLVTGYGSAVAAGWAREFTAANKAVFRAATGNRLRLRIDDTGTNDARAIGYEVMTDVDTGTGAFPTNGQVSGGLYIRKSNTADNTARPWVLVATETSFYFFPDTGGTDWLVTPTAANISGQFYFGEIVSFKAGDAYNTLIIGSEATGTSQCRFASAIIQTTAAPTALIGHYMARPYYQSAGSINVSKWAAMSFYSQTTMGASGTQFPDPISGAMHLSPMYMLETGPGNVGYIRGILPGLWCPAHASPGNHGDQFSGSGESAGKTFLGVTSAVAGTLGRVLVEISNTW